MAEIPSILTKVSPSGLGVTWVEINSGSPSANQYLVDYHNGIVTFHSSRNSETLLFSYSGTGLTSIPAQRIYTRVNNNNITETLQDIIDAGVLQGPQGEKGLNWKGTYNGATSYVVDDAIYYQGSSYRCILNSTGNLPTNGTFWTLLVQKGDAGSGMVWKGAYNGVTAYVVGDAVSYQGSSYICIQISTSNLPTNTSYWTMFAQKGSQGDQGTQGAQGIQGTQGIQGSQGSQGIQGVKGDRGLTWRGSYSGATAYVPDDAVSYSGVSYVCKLSSTGNLPTNTTYWDVFVQGSGGVTDDILCMIWY